MKRVRPNGVCFTTGKFNTKMSELIDNLAPEVRAKLDDIAKTKPVITEPKKRYTPKKTTQLSSPKLQFGKVAKKLVV